MRTQCAPALVIPAAMGLLAAAVSSVPAGTLEGQWEPFVSRHYTFTIVKPTGWPVEEGWQQRPAKWWCRVSHPSGLYQCSTTHGGGPGGSDPMAAARHVVAALRRQHPDLRLAPKARMRKLGARTVFLFEGTYTKPYKEQPYRIRFRHMVAGGQGLMLSQRIDAAEGRLKEAAPLLLQTLANLRVARNVAQADGGGARPAPARLVPHALARGWGAVATPPNWQIADLGKGQVIAVDPSQQLYFVVATANFIAPRYNLARVPNALVSPFARPHQAMVIACTKQGHGTGFRMLQVHNRQDMEQQARRSFAAGRPCAVEDFLYTFAHKGRAYKGVTLGWSIGNYMQASWSFGHFTIWAPAGRFDAALPTLGQIAASYELNKEKAGKYIADGLARYYAGIKKLSKTIARNSEQIRRENYAQHMERGRVRDYLSYKTTRMIMGEFDYLASASGYLTHVRGDPSGLYDAQGNKLTDEPYGESVTRHMQEINSRELYELVRPR